MGQKSTNIRGRKEEKGAIRRRGRKVAKDDWRGWRVETRVKEGKKGNKIGRDWALWYVGRWVADFWAPGAVFGSRLLHNFGRLQWQAILVECQEMEKGDQSSRAWHANLPPYDQDGSFWRGRRRPLNDHSWGPWDQVRIWGPSRRLNDVSKRLVRLQCSQGFQQAACRNVQNEVRAGLKMCRSDFIEEFI